MIKTILWKQIAPIAIILIICFKANAQELEVPERSGERFFDGMIMDDQVDEVAAELKELLDSWIENPICVNSDEILLLADYGLITMYQFHKLKEYILIYGDLVSLYELKNVDGWDLETSKRISVYLTTLCRVNAGTDSRKKPPGFKSQLVLKTAINPQLRKGYRSVETNGTNGTPYYIGPPVKLSLRYDLSLKGKVEFGLRAEKDQGEPFLIKNEIFGANYKGIDHLSGFLKLNFRGLIRTLILGDYRLSFGYGLNYSGSTMMAGNRSGLIFPADKLRANTSMSESGFLRGVAANFHRGHFGLTGFVSYCNQDGSSIRYDAQSGKEISFSTMSYSGLHRSEAEINRRKTITEQIYGASLVYTNNWLKTGLIGYYDQISIPMRSNEEPYARFRFNGRNNFVGGATLAAWLRRVRLVAEVSMSLNKALAMIGGIEFIPLDGISINLAYRKFDRDYHNLHGSGFTSGNNDDGESGLQVAIRMETHFRWLFNMVMDVSSKGWVSYQLNAPARKTALTLTGERAWRDVGGLFCSIRHKKESISEPGQFFSVDHPVTASVTNLRLEARNIVNRSLNFKTRIEACIYSLPGNALQTGWLLFQDVSYPLPMFPISLWLRVCLFQSESYYTRIYAYENDVLYDFTSFMHDGKGLRAVFLMRYSPWRWLDLWLRYSSVSYYDRLKISSGWDEVDGNRLEEIEFQVRVKLQDQYSFSRFRR